MTDLIFHKTRAVGVSALGIPDRRFYHERVYVCTHPGLRLNEYAIERRNRVDGEARIWKHVEVVSWARADEQGYDDPMLGWLERHLRRKLDAAMFGPKMQPSASAWKPER